MPGCLLHNWKTAGGGGHKALLPGMQAEQYMLHAPFEMHTQRTSLPCIKTI